jgi:SAM-dependent methyltransferase
MERGRGGAVDEARREGAPSLIAFVHIPKTGGGAVKSVFAASPECVARTFGPLFRNSESTLAALEKDLNRIARSERQHVVIGHIPYGIFRSYLSPDTRYVTFIRDPLDHVLSRYYRHIDYGISLEEALERGLPTTRRERKCRVPMANLATRFLSGRPSPFGKLPPRALDDAKANLREFAFVGLTERFDESVALLERTLGLGYVPYQRKHVNPNRPAVEQTPDDQRQLIEEYNRLDIELYACARRLFEERAASAGEDLAAAAQTVQRAARRASKPARARGPKRRSRPRRARVGTTPDRPSPAKRAVKKAWRDEPPPPVDTDEMQHAVAAINAHAAVPIEVAGARLPEGRVSQNGGSGTSGSSRVVKAPILREEHHRQYGRPWAMGRYTFEFVVDAGLLPQHRLLDFGCGALRLGNWVIPYLEPGNYFGVDNHLGSLEAATTYEIPLHGLEGRRPRILWSDDFAFSHFGTRFDYIVDFSSSSAVPRVRMERLFRNFADVLAPGGRLLMSCGPTFRWKVPDNTEEWGLTPVRSEVVQPCPLLEGHGFESDNLWWEFVRDQRA